MNDRTGRQDEPQSERGEPGSRGMPSPGASEGAGRRSGVIEDHDLPSTDPDQPDAPEPGYTTEIGNSEPVVPPHKGRTGQSDDAVGSQRPSNCSTGSSATPKSSGVTSDDEDREHPDSTEDTDRGVGPAHQSGVSRAEDQS